MGPSCSLSLDTMLAVGSAKCMCPETLMSNRSIGPDGSIMQPYMRQQGVVENQHALACKIEKCCLFVQMESLAVVLVYTA